MTNCASGYNGRGTGTRLYLILPRQSPPSIQLRDYIDDITSYLRWLSDITPPLNE